MGEFLIYRGTGTPDEQVDQIRALSDPPPWRVFDGGPLAELNRDEPVGRRLSYLGRAAPYRADGDTVKLVNVALHLRRPLLVTGEPGTGKSTLAYAVAHELRLGPVLRWPITTRSTVDGGLYRYDAVGRLEAAGLHRPAAGAAGVADDSSIDEHPRMVNPDDIGRFIQLGPLGTAFAPYELPRVLLVDEIDKGDIDLPNELLDVFEEGEYPIPELARISDFMPEVKVRPADNGPPVTVLHGRVRCYAFPFVVMTSNGEREFPPAFLRRCVQLRLGPPDQRWITAIVTAHLGENMARQSAGVIQDFIDRRERGHLATDQLLNAVYLLHQASGGSGPSRKELIDIALRQLNTSS